MSYFAPRRFREFNWFTLSIVALIGLALTGVGITLCLGTYRFSHIAQSTSGNVTKNEQVYYREKSTPSSKYSYRSTITYTVRSGETETFSITGMVFDHPLIPEGQTVPILYDPANVKDARLGGFKGMWGTAISCLIAGLGILLVELFAFSKNKAFKEARTTRYGAAIIVIAWFAYWAWFFLSKPY